MPETIPILPSADFDVTASFWSALGFTERGRWEAEYLILRHEALAIELHFWHDATVDRWTNDVACYVRFVDPDAARACHAAWRGVEVAAPAGAVRSGAAIISGSGVTIRLGRMCERSLRKVRR